MLILSDYKEQQMRDPEEQKLLTQTDGPATYGKGSNMKDKIEMILFRVIFAR